MFKSNEVVGLLKGFEKGAVLNYPSGINESIKDYVDLTNRNIKSNPDKTKLNFRIFSPFHIDKETQVILYNVSIAYGERAGGWSSISIFKYKNDQWI